MIPIWCETANKEQNINIIATKKLKNNKILHNYVINIGNSNSTRLYGLSYIE